MVSTRGKADAWRAASGIAIGVLGTSPFVSPHFTLGGGLTLLNLGISLAVSGLVLLGIVRIGLPSTNTIWPAFALMVAITAGSFSAAPSDYGTFKILTLLTVVPLSLFAPAVLRPTDPDFRVSLRVMYAVTATSVLALLPQAIFVDPLSRLGYGGAGEATITAGRAAGLLILLSVFAIRSSRIVFVSPLGIPLAIASLILGVIVLLASATRGAILSSLLASVVLLALDYRQRARHESAAFSTQRAILSLASLLVGFLATTYVALQFVSLSPRLSRSLASGGLVPGSSEAVRFHLLRESFELGASFPLGIGWGSFAYETDSSYIYPHNIFLEFLVEGGWIALLAFFLSVAIAARRLLVFTHSTAPVLFGVFLYALLISLFSSDVVGNRLVFLVIGLGLAVGQSVRHRNPLVGPMA